MSHEHEHAENGKVDHIHSTPEKKAETLAAEISGRAWVENDNRLAEKAKTLEFQDAMKEGGVCVRCMDEGTANMDTGEEGELCLAGSGILMFPELSREERLKKVAKILFDHGCRQVTSHSDCGAAKLAARVEGGDPVQLAKKWAMDLQTELNKLTGEQIKASHIEEYEMVRAKEGHHVATGVWFVATKERRFNPDQVSDSPRQFVVDWGLAENPAYSLTELAVAVGIAYGSHGFGDALKKDKFTITVLADSPAELQQIKGEIREAVENFPSRPDAEVINVKNIKFEDVKINGVVVLEAQEERMKPAA